MPSKRKTQGDFPDTDEKDALRVKDSLLLQSLMERKARRLNYLGLAGIRALDIHKWKDCLDHVTVIERPIRDEDARNTFKTQLTLSLTPLFNGNVRIEFADIWDFLVSPSLDSLNHFPDVVNLDFCGGLVNEVKMDYPRQKAAFQKVFEMAQKVGEDFIILMTLLPRDRGKMTYKKYLQDHVSALSAGLGLGNGEIRSVVEANGAFHARDNLRLFKACLPLVLDEVGRAHHFIVKPVYIRLYTKMIHLAFSCSFIRGVLGVPNDPMSVLQILNLPLRKLLADGSENQEWPPQIANKDTKS